MEYSVTKDTVDIVLSVLNVGDVVVADDTIDIEYFIQMVQDTFPRTKITVYRGNHICIGGSLSE